MTGTTTHCLGGGASVIAASAADLLTQSSNWGLHEDESVEESVDALDALDAMSKRRK